MPKTNSTTLSDKDQKIMAVFLSEVRKKNKNITSSVDWKPYYDVLGFKNEKAAKDAFDYTCLKFANIEKAMNSGPSTPDGKAENDTPTSSAAKKATPARAQRKRKQAAKSASDDDLDLIKDEDEFDLLPSKRTRIGGTGKENSIYEI